jgi:Tol biopolymer transport system component
MKTLRGSLALLCAGVMLVGLLPGGATLAQSDTLEVIGMLAPGTADGQPLPEGLPVALVVFDSDHQPVANYAVDSEAEYLYHFTGVVRAPGYSYQVTVSYADVDQTIQSSPIIGNEPAIRLDLTLYEQTTDRSTVAIQKGSFTWSYSRTSPDVLTVWFSLSLLNSGDRIVTSPTAGTSSYFGSAPIELPAGAFDIHPLRSADRLTYEITTRDGLPVVTDTAPLFPGQAHTVGLIYSLPYTGSVVIQHRFSDALLAATSWVPNDTVQFQGDQFEAEGTWRYHRSSTAILPLAKDAVVDPSTDFSLVKEYKLLAPLPPETPLTITLAGTPTHFGEILTADDARIVPLPPGLISGTLLFNATQPDSTTLQALRLDDGEITTLTNLPAGARSPSWSPNGQQFVFIAKEAGNLDIYVFTLADGQVTRLTNNPDQEWSPAWSPDGAQIVFGAKYAGNEALYVMPVSGGEARALTSDLSSVSDPAWSPDGTQIAFETTRDGNSEIYVIQADGSDPRNLTNDPEDDYSPAWSPDGSQIAFVSGRDGNTNIYVMNPDGSDPGRLVDHPASEWYPTWSPDGQWLAFTSNRSGMDEIYIMALDGSALYRVGEEANDYAWLSWQPAPAP